MASNIVSQLARVMPRTVPALYVSFIRLFPFQGGGGRRAFIHGLAEQNNITTTKSVKPLPLLVLLPFLLPNFCSFLQK